ARVNEPVSFGAQNPNTSLYNYEWEVSDGRSASGPAASFSFASTGTYMVRLTVSAQSDPSIRNSATRSITIVPAETPEVNVGIQAPFFATIRTPVSFIVPNPTAGATYTWDFGDGETTSGTTVSHSYSTIGEYQVRLTGKLGATVNSITHNITIGTTPVPMPVITATHNPPTGPGSGYNITFNATGSYSPVPGVTITDYNITYGDGASDNNNTGIFFHTYPNPGAGNSGSYTALLTITDSNGQTNSTYITISVWGD
ncbi:MAG: PKD domain-containing protein, partial [Candidatus Margulisiibacteriota bacterium]